MKNQFKIKEIKFDLIISIIFFSVLIAYTHYTGQTSLSNFSLHYDALISLSSTLLGFLITALAILITLPSTETIEKFKRHTMFPMLFGTFLLTIYIFLIFLILSLIALLLLPNNLILSWILIFFLIYSMISFMRILWILKNILL